MPMLHRAYSLISIKSIDEDERIITGIATTPSPDRMGDVVEPKGAEFTLPIPLLWQHKASEPIGEVYHAKVTADGIEVTARIAKTVEPGKLKDRLDEAWQSLKMGLVRGLSIGFSAIEYAFMDDGGIHFQKWSWLELSAVTIPANADASIQSLKSFDTGRPAASGTRRPVVHLSGASDSPRATAQRATMKKSYTEQITGWEATRAAKAAQMDAILEKAADAGVTLDAAQKEEHDTLAGEVKEIDETLVRLRAAEKRAAESATAVKGSTSEEGSQSRPTAKHQIQITRTLPKGILFARYAMCMGASRGIPVEAMRLAKEHYPDDPGVLKLVEKTAVAGGSTTGSHYLDDMVPYNVMNDFIEYLRPGSIIGKFGGPNPGGGPNYPSLNRVGFNERVTGMSTGYTAGWRGEGLPALPSAAVTYNASLLFNNMTAMAVLTKEAIRFSNPSAEEKVRNELARAVNGKLDLDFVDPAKAASGATSPASITNGVAATAPTGTTAAFLRTDLASMIKLFAQNNLDPADIVLIMSAQMALQFSLMITTLGINQFPNISMAGGNLLGFPVIVSEHLTAVGSPSTQTIIAVKASDVYLADDGVVTVEASDQASLEMVDTSSQSGISGTGASLVSLWQNGLVGLLASREITWKLRRSTAVQYISPAAYAA
jgi:HK97 family phage major capsid protein/HK97 family phage prohead protease